jgi:hypothetical protein
MNLLIDQRDQSNVPEPDWTPQPAEEPASPLLEEPAIPRGAETPLDYYNFEESEGRRRGILGPILIILFLLAAIGAAAYYGFFYKPQELGEFPKSTPKSTTVTTETAPAVVEPATTTPEVTSGPGSSNPASAEKPAATLPAPAHTEPAEPPVTSVSGDGSPMTRAAAMLSGILAARPAELQVSTLILDRQSFSAEVSADNRDIIENFASRLKNSVPGGLSSSPASGYYSGTRALVTGTFPALNPAQQPALDESQIQQIKQNLRTSAQDGGLKVIEVSQAKEITREGEVWTPVFVKVSGSESQFEQYCQRIAGDLPEMRLDKIILQTGAAKAVGVIRLEAKKR